VRWTGPPFLIQELLALFLSASCRAKVLYTKFHKQFVAENYVVAADWSLSGAILVSAVERTLVSCMTLTFGESEWWFSGLSW
jgi:hypothetical protein